MMKLYLIVLFLFVSFLSVGQVFDDFSDNNLSSNPTWNGDTGSYKINSDGQLQLNENGSGAKYLSTSDTFLFEAEWRMFINLDFAPSNNNFLKVFLSSDQNDLSSSTSNGYFIRIGENGSNDGIDLYKKLGAVETKIIDGLSQSVAINPKLNLKVIRDNAGNWTVFADLSGGDNFALQGTVNDKSVLKKVYSGIQSIYTTSNATKFYFDNYYSGPIIKDTIAPEVIGVEIISEDSILINFNESVDEASTENQLNYTINQSVGNPSHAFLQSDKRSVLLQLSNKLSLGKQYALTYDGIKDLAGNSVNSQNFNFYYFVPSNGDVIVNEIFPDPTPSIGMPEAEFVELYNNSSFSIDLNGWTLEDASSKNTLNSFVLLPNEYLILCNSNDQNLFAPYGNVLGLSLPSLNNSGDNLTLRDNHGNIMDQVFYNLSWYKDAVKENGGYSLERVNPNHPCSDESNWKASVKYDGGTPGSINSVYSNAADVLSPKVINVEVLDSLTVNLTFSEQLDISDVIVQNFKSGCGRSIQNVSIQFGKNVEIIFDSPFQSLDTCSVLFRNLKDCWGNSNAYWQSASFQYIVPNDAEMYDIVVSEIMADPDPPLKLPSYEYVEIFNRSNKYISLNNWTLEDLSISSILTNKILPPNSYLIICSLNNANDFEKFGDVMGLSNFPSLGNSSDRLILKDSKNQMISFVEYSDAWYQNDLKKEGGFSLELIDPDNYCTPNENWIASKDLKGGTPGKENSVFSSNPDVSPPEIERILVKDSLIIEVFFNESMDSNSISDINNFKLNSQHPKNAIVTDQFNRKVKLVLNQPLVPLDEYSLVFTRILDCAGNQMDFTKKIIGLPQLLDSADLIINEILFNPKSNGYDFVELFNRSNKIIDFKGLYISNLDENYQLDQPVLITDLGYQILPNDYVVLTINTNNIVENYYVQNPEKIIECSSFPSFNDDEGYVVISNRVGAIIDKVYYSEDYQFELLDDKNGVSLERINPDEKSQNKSNWHSAVSSVGYATPTYKNSQYSEVSFNVEQIEIFPKIFSPNNDGYDDVLKISYSFNDESTFGTIKIFDIRGREVKEIANNNLFGKQGFYTWDGIDNTGKKSLSGVYIILIQTNNLQGESSFIKKTCTLAF